MIPQAVMIFTILIGYGCPSDKLASQFLMLADWILALLHPSLLQSITSIWIQCGRSPLVKTPVSTFMDPLEWWDTSAAPACLFSPANERCALLFHYFPKPSGPGWSLGLVAKIDEGLRAHMESSGCSTARLNDMLSYLNRWWVPSDQPTAS